MRKRMRSFFCKWAPPAANHLQEHTVPDNSEHGGGYVCIIKSTCGHGWTWGLANAWNFNNTLYGLKFFALFFLIKLKFFLCKKKSFLLDKEINTFLRQTIMFFYFYVWIIILLKLITNNSNWCKKIWIKHKNVIIRIICSFYSESCMNRFL